jgi:hypothetical protein
VIYQRSFHFNFVLLAAANYKFYFAQQRVLMMIMTRQLLELEKENSAAMKHLRHNKKNKLLEESWSRHIFYLLEVVKGHHDMMTEERKTHEKLS